MSKKPDVKSLFKAAKAQRESTGPAKLVRGVVCFVVCRNACLLLPMQHSLLSGSLCIAVKGAVAGAESKSGRCGSKGSRAEGCRGGESLSRAILHFFASSCRGFLLLCGLPHPVSLPTSSSVYDDGVHVLLFGVERASGPPLFS